MVYVRDCVSFDSSDVHLLNECVDVAVEITRRTFLKHVDIDSLRQLERELGYMAHAKQGLTMASDWAVSYFKSTFNGRPCVYVRWSAIEHIFHGA
jgi:mRNA degradation ribonuclease J1/J2